MQNGTIRFDTNEVGFTRADVEALCSVCSSSKVQPGLLNNQTGEKGIGFKSAFGVADIVWIRSGPYSFKFDANKPLGKVIPIWADFPQATLSRQTSTLLQIRSDVDELKLAQELHNLDAQLLLFSRRIKEIKIDVHHTQKSLSKSLRCGKLQNTASGLLKTTLQGSQSYDYMISQYHIPRLPYDPRRDGFRGSKILIAFPVKPTSATLHLETQNVYAFFPIRDYGFKVSHNCVQICHDFPLSLSSSSYNQISFSQLVAKISTTDLSGIRRSATKFPRHFSKLSITSIDSKDRLHGFHMWPLTTNGMDYSRTWDKAP